ncbi:hypothetical protein A0H81_11057 [Grifola frondosa]|uniref:Uncharacterized protein n=1 Tax=Grifola frondosa TaxID=5627 RepID=A0A1C7LW05_GRIFR|nr:hypothetical protein A0H81_11057 [Grifola frondosa]
MSHQHANTSAFAAVVETARSQSRQRNREARKTVALNHPPTRRRCPRIADENAPPPSSSYECSILLPTPSLTQDSQICGPSRRAANQLPAVPGGSFLHYSPSIRVLARMFRTLNLQQAHHGPQPIMKSAEINTERTWISLMVVSGTASNVDKDKSTFDILAAQYVQQLKKNGHFPTQITIADSKHFGTKKLLPYTEGVTGTVCGELIGADRRGGEGNNQMHVERFRLMLENVVYFGRAAPAFPCLIPQFLLPLQTVFIAG